MRTRFLLPLACTLALLMASGPALAEDASELELEHQMSMACVTPHVEWARPYARGKLRVLFFCNARGTVPREGVELMQRFDFDLDAVFWARIVDSTQEGWHGGPAGLQRMLRLAEKPYDCYVFFGIPLSNLTAEMQVKVLKPVVDGGAGIVLVGTNDKRVLKKEKLYEAPDGFAAAIAAPGLYHVGKGRGVLLPNRPEIPYDLGWQNAYEAWQERLGRAIVWAAGRAPQVGLALRGLDGKKPVARADLPKLALALALDDPAKRPLTVEASLRLLDGSRIKLPVPLGALPLLPAGRHWLDAVARSGSGVEAWATVPLEVASARRVEAVKLEKDWGEVGERLRGSVSLDGPPGAEERVLVRLRDARDRILVQKEFPPDQPGPFDFPVEGWMPMLVRVEATLVDKDGEVASAWAYFNVVKRHRGQFNFLIWDTPSGTLASYAEESLARLGTTLQLRGGTPPRTVAACDVAWVPYTTRILESHEKSGVMRPFCWNDEEKVAAQVQDLAAKYRGSRQHGVFVYSLGDENSVRGSCTSPFCLKAYRGYLAKEYGTVEALNASWGSAYKSFDEVELLKPDDNLAAEARRIGNYPRWYDRQAFRSWNYVQYCKRFAAAYRAMDPQALTGFEGAGRFSQGDDIDLFVRELGFWSPYPGTADEVLRSIAPPGFPHANWMGYRKDAASLIAKYWRMVTRGCTSAWWWRWDGIGRFHGFLAPHLGPWPATQELVDETRIVRDGLGDLLIRSEMVDSGIAMLYSQPSGYAGQLEGTYGGVEENHRAWHEGIRELGLNFRYVTDRQLRLGEFDPKRFKTLILSRAEAIGPKEAEAIRTFVRGGGFLLADVRPGIYDGHCKPLAKGCLDDLFGVRRAAAAPARKGDGAIEMENLAVALKDVPCDPSVALAGGQAGGRCGEVPLMISTEAGPGGTLLLNFPMTAYPALGEPGTPEDAAALWQRLAASAGIRPPLVTRTKGQRTRNLETVHWRDGEIDIVALWRGQGEDEEVEVELPAPMHVRDLRLGRSFAGAKTFPTKVLGGRPTFLVLSPRPLAKVEAALARGSVAPGERAALRLQVPGAAGLHACCVRAKTPDGRPAEWLRQVVLVGGEPVEVTLPIAVNDPAGAWTIEVADLFAEAPAALRLQVGAAGPK